MQSLVWDSQPLPAYQYFENVRNFINAAGELKLPAFEASDLEKESGENGSAGKKLLNLAESCYETYSLDNLLYIFMWMLKIHIVWVTGGRIEKEVKEEIGLKLTNRKDENFREWYFENRDGEACDEDMEEACDHEDVEEACREDVEEEQGDDQEEEY